VQEKARRARRLHDQDEYGPTLPNAAIETIKDKTLPDVPRPGLRPLSAGSATRGMPPPSGPLHKPKSSLGNLSRFAGGVAGRKLKK
jgi:vacuole morphology and inheritance protein 14